MLLILIIQIEPNQDLPIPRYRHRIECPPRRGDPLRATHFLPVRIILDPGEFIDGVGAGERRAITPTVVSQMVEGDSIQVPSHALRMSDFAASQFLQRCDGGVLKNIRGDLWIANPPQDQRTQSRVVPIHRGQSRDRIRHRRKYVRFRREHRGGYCVFVDGGHNPSISRNHQMPQRIAFFHSGLGLLAAIVLVVCATPAALASVSCANALGASAFSAGPLRIVGQVPASLDLFLVPGHVYLFEVAESGTDAIAEILKAKSEVIARADNPERRTGTQRAVVTAPDSGFLTVRVRGKDQINGTGTAAVRVFDLVALRTRPDCMGVFRTLAAADADYALGQLISRGHSASGAHGAREAFLRAADGYSTAERALAGSADALLRGRTLLALAAVEYFDLADWGNTVDWAKAAARTLGGDDAYRRARADALVAAAWIEIGSPPVAVRTVRGDETNSGELLARARAQLHRLSRFHLRRGETYDAGLQFTNVGLTYLYESRFRECVSASARSSRLFGAIGDTLRRAQAWQNQALCLWGLGRLPEAQRWFERALTDIGPEPFPSIFLASITNTALADYALGHFDESLRLYDRALGFARRAQSERDEAYCLYGIGVNYYALGDRERAREFLERSLIIRTAALDVRGRVTSLRALAAVSADQGRMDEAVAADREALGLAEAPSSMQRIRIQLAAHTAAAGYLEDAKAQLDDVLLTGPTADPLIHAEGLLQRAVVLRRMGRLREAVADLGVARPRLHRLGGVRAEFDANLELARTLRLAGRAEDALAAVDRALGQGAAVRLRTANPELRVQLAAPLRSAYDVKIELQRARYEAALAAGRNAEADRLAAASFGTADASRARSLADLAAQEYAPAARRTLASEFRRRDELYRELSGRRFALESRVDSSGSGDPRAKHLTSDIAELERQADTISTLIAKGSTPSGGTSRPRVAEGGPPRVPEDSVLVSYWLGSESAYAWVVTSTEVHWIRLPGPAVIDRQAAAFRRSLTRLVDVPVERRLLDARALYELIIRPVDPWLSGARRWVFIPDGSLDYVPFAALRTADGFVAMQHDVAVAPAAWMLNAHEGRPPPQGRRQLLLVADPVYQADDPRLATVGPAPSMAQTSPQRSGAPGLFGPPYQRLPFAAAEATAIAEQFWSADVDQLVGVDATRQRLLAMDWSKYRFIHVATHGSVDTQFPQLSALMLGSYDPNGNAVDGALRVSDLALLTLTADVAIFSACDTALGKEAPGEGLIGISSTALARGARAVVGSLWPISDEIGARLMTVFYRYLLRDSSRAPEALGAAERAILARDASADPAIWAAFQVSVVALGQARPGFNVGPAQAATKLKPQERLDNDGEVPATADQSADDIPLTAVPGEDIFARAMH